MLGLSIGHIVLFLLVLVLLFGTSKLKNLGKDLGGALKDFRKSINDDDLEGSSTKPKDKN